MMDMAIRPVDDLFHGRDLAAGRVHDLAPNVLFRPQGTIGLRPDGRSLIGRDGLDREALDFITAKRPAAPNLPTGLFELHDVYLAPPDGAIFDFNNRCCWIGRLLGWNARDFRLWSETLPSCSVRKDSLRLDPPESGGIRDLDAAVLISAPHYDGYGHWLLDFLPRINMALDNGLGELPFYRHSGHDWAREMAHCLAPVNLIPAGWPASSWVRVRRLFVPSVSRILHGADEAALTATWAKLSMALAPGEDLAESPAAPPRRIAVSRQGWSNSSNKRRLLNARRVELFLEVQGFDIIQPENLSLAEQRQVFRAAEIVIGEDGSGMHNTIHCRPGTRIGLVAMGRINYIHLLTGRMFDHGVTYIPTEPVDGHEASGLLKVRRLRPKVLEAALARLRGAGGPD